MTLTMAQEVPERRSFVISPTQSSPLHYTLNQYGQSTAHSRLCPVDFFKLPLTSSSGLRIILKCQQANLTPRVLRAPLVSTF